MAPTLNTDEQIAAFVKKVYEEIIQRHDEEKKEALRVALKESRDAIVELAVPDPPRRFSRPLPSSETRTTVSNLLLCQPCGKKQSDSNDAEPRLSFSEGRSEESNNDAAADTLVPGTTWLRPGIREMFLSRCKFVI
jgi:hypothetical protein